VFRPSALERAIVSAGRERREERVGLIVLARWRKDGRAGKGEAANMRQKLGLLRDCQ